MMATRTVCGDADGARRARARRMRVHRTLPLSGDCRAPPACAAGGWVRAHGAHCGVVCGRQCPARGPAAPRRMLHGSARSLGQAGARHLMRSARRRRSHACVLCLDNHVACRRSPSAALCRSHVSLGRLRLCRARRRASSPRRCALRGVHALRHSWRCLIGRSRRRRACRPSPEHSIATVAEITCGPNGSRLGSIISDVGRKPEVWEKPRRRSFAHEWPCRQVKQASLASGRRCEEPGDIAMRCLLRTGVRLALSSSLPARALLP